MPSRGHKGRFRKRDKLNIAAALETYARYLIAAVENLQGIQAREDRTALEFSHWARSEMPSLASFNSRPVESTPSRQASNRRLLLAPLLQAIELLKVAKLLRSHHCYRLPVEHEITLRGDVDRKGEPIDSSATVAALRAALLELGVGHAWMPIELLAKAHLHLETSPPDGGENRPPQCTTSPCKKLGLCRALDDLLDVIDSPTRKAIRKLAQTEFDVAGCLELLAVQLLEALWGYKSGTSQIPPAERNDLLISLPSRLLLVKHGLEPLDRQTRRELPSADNQKARAGTLTRETLPSMTFHLYRAGFSKHDIAKLIVDTESRIGRLPLKRVELRLRIYRGKEDSRRTRHHGTPIA